MRLNDLQEPNFRKYFENRLSGNGFRKGAIGYTVPVPS
jgi:hypothetical protein